MTVCIDLCALTPPVRGLRFISIKFLFYSLNEFIMSNLHWFKVLQAYLYANSDMRDQSVLRRISRIVK